MKSKRHERGVSKNIRVLQLFTFSWSVIDREYEMRRGFWLYNYNVIATCGKVGKLETQVG